MALTSSLFKPCASVATMVTEFGNKPKGGTSRLLKVRVKVPEVKPTRSMSPGEARMNVSTSRLLSIQEELSSVTSPSGSSRSKVTWAESASSFSTITLEISGAVRLSIVKDCTSETPPAGAGLKTVIWA